jgi:hypothetical protein
MTRFNGWLNNALFKAQIGDADRDRQRAHALRLLTDTCAVFQSQLVADGSGGKKRSFVQIAASEPCRFDRQSGTGDPSQGLDARVTFFRVSLRYNSVVGPDCQLVHNGHTYEVWSRGRPDAGHHQDGLSGSSKP